VVITSTTIIGNSSRYDPGIYVGPVDSLTISDSTISGNVTESFGFTSGGGMRLKRTGPVAITNTTINGNSASFGGGVYADELRSGTTIVNSTISGNQSVYGAGILARVVPDSEPIRIVNSTIADNVGTDSAGGLVVFQGLSGYLGRVLLDHTIVASNPGGDCRVIATDPSLIVSDGFNLASDDSCNLTDPTDLPSVAPLLSPLADNGGPTRTHALAPGSPAIDAGAPTSEPFDQRGVARPQDGDGDGVAICDIGAFELEPAADGFVTLCHVPPGNPANAHTITVGAPAANAHLNHGDTLGPCVDAAVDDDASGPGVRFQLDPEIEAINATDPGGPKRRKLSRKR
jgi:hypothetical protein